MKLSEFLLLLLGVFRLTEIINYEEIARPIREFFNIAHGGSGMTSLVETDNKFRNFFGKAISCFSCLSVWTSLIMSVLYLLSKKIAMFVSMILGLSWLTVNLNKVKNKYL